MWYLIFNIEIVNMRYGNEKENENLDDYFKDIYYWVSKIYIFIYLIRKEFCKIYIFIFYFLGVNIKRLMIF